MKNGNIQAAAGIVLLFGSIIAAVLINKPATTVLGVIGALAGIYLWYKAVSR